MFIWGQRNKGSAASELEKASRKQLQTSYRWHLMIQASQAHTQTNALTWGYKLQILGLRVARVNKPFLCYLLEPYCVPSFPLWKLKAFPPWHSSSLRGFYSAVLPIHIIHRWVCMDLWMGYVAENSQATFSFPLDHNYSFSVYLQLEFKI